jgi:hypothetical protein
MAIGGKLTTWKHGTHGALTTLTDFTSKTRSVTPNYDRETVDATTFGDADKDYEMSFKNYTYEVMYKGDSTLYGQLREIFANDESVSVQYSVDGTASGKPKDEITAFIQKLSPPAQVGQLIEFSVTWQGTGAMAFGSHA